MDLTGPLTPEPTADGSYTLFSEDFGEWFHSRAGAYAEAHTTYVEGTDLPTLALQPRLTLLDVCYGLGYNSAAALETIHRINPQCQVTLVALELDGRVPRCAIAQHFTQGWSVTVQDILQDLATAQTAQRPWLTAHLRLGDARQQIQPLVRQGFQADVIFLDPFSPPHCPQLWTVEFLAQVAACLAPTGRLATYSCAAAVRAALQQAGLAIGPIPAMGRQWPGTLAQHHPQGLAPLCQREREHLDTRAAVPYRDPTLTDPAEVIQQRRAAEQATSGLASTGQWRRRWLPAKKTPDPDDQALGSPAGGSKPAD